MFALSVLGCNHENAFQYSHESSSRHPPSSGAPRHSPAARSAAVVHEAPAGPLGPAVVHALAKALGAGIL